jgi:polysaccharide export outer membrane protein
MRKCLLIFYTGFLSCFLLSSCKVTQTTIPYFHDLPDTARPTLAKTVHFKNPVIQPDDLLSITIQTVDNTFTNATVNTTNANSSAGGTGVQVPSGYLVNKDGMVELPFVGRIKISGLTIAQAQDAIWQAADKYFNNPIVNVRYANFKITVLGEVKAPSSFVMPNEKVNIFDAIGMAGDLTIYGRRDNILLLRDTTGDNRQMVRLNLNSKTIVSSPYFYLQPNDIIYVEPNSNRIKGTDIQRGRTLSLIGITVSTLTALTVIISRL